MSSTSRRARCGGVILSILLVGTVAPAAAARAATTATTTGDAASTGLTGDEAPSLFDVVGRDDIRRHLEDRGELVDQLDRASATRPQPSGALTQSIGSPACVTDTGGDDVAEGFDLDVVSYVYYCQSPVAGLSVTTSTGYSDEELPLMRLLFDTDGDLANGSGGAEYVVEVAYDPDLDELVAGMIRTPSAALPEWRFAAYVDVARFSPFDLTVAWPEWAMAPLSSMSFLGFMYQAGPGGPDRFPQFPQETWHSIGLNTGPAPSAPWGPSRFVPLANPSRILDTRNGLGAPLGKRAPGSTLDVLVRGRGGVPDDPAVQAVVLNVTAVDASNPGFVQVFPTGQSSGAAFSNLNLERPGQVVPNLAVVPVGDGGAVSLYTDGGAHLLADVAGYFLAAASSSPGRFLALDAPVRMLDTRSGIGGVTGERPANSTTAVGVGPAGQGGRAVVLNVTAVGARDAGFVTVYPGGQTRPNVSNLNVVPGQTVPNLVIVGTGPGAVVNITTNSRMHLIVDVIGSFTAEGAPVESAGLFVPIRPARLIDTRVGYPDAITPLGDESVEVPVRDRVGIPPSGVGGVLLNVTATQAEAPGFVTVFASEAAVPLASNLNIERAGHTIANAAVAKVGRSCVSLVSYAGAHLIADTSGYFTA